MQLKNATQPQIVVIKESQPTLAISERQDTFNDPYSPPTKNDPLFYTPKITSDIRPVPGVPINIETRGLSTGYQQIGILTPSGGSRGNDLNMDVIVFTTRIQFMLRDIMKHSARPFTIIIFSNICHFSTTGNHVHWLYTE